MSIEKKYMSKWRFPRTTQDDLEYKHQVLIDSANYDQLVRYVQEGNKLDWEQRAIVRELEKKLILNHRHSVKHTEHKPD